jgi:hypothetical protein
LQGGDEADGRVGDETEVFDAQVSGKRRFEFLMERPIVGQPAAVPNLLEIR